MSAVFLKLFNMSITASWLILFVLLVRIIKICVINSNKALYIVALFMQKNILRFSQTFLQKVIAISQIICYNSRARVE